MAYRNRPFNPLAPTPNQVITELNQANENFDILAQAFLGNNPETFIVKNADKVDGFHASTTPTPFTIPVAGADGKISLGWLPDSVLSGGGGGGYRRINMTGATSDYDLQVGEEAYYEWFPGGSTMTSLPLRITVSGILYELIIVSRHSLITYGINITLYPNNTSYSYSVINPFRRALIEFGGTSNEIRLSRRDFTAFQFNSLGDLYTTAPNSIIYALINTKRERKSIIYLSMGYDLWYPVVRYGAYFWDNTDINWTSLGTLACNHFSCGVANDNLIVLVRRLV